MEYLKIDPIGELLKAIAIMHGEHYANLWREVINEWVEEIWKNYDS